ncbi:hypothetical protein V500_07503 [Pseudogymnoascus sp. VKM F-4518 (FW-2643)]|nr:hypothetical protein V500_07503 [Pseudogymnoascus sp. VKM F-4518 (FW-2643)]
MPIVSQYDSVAVPTGDVWSFVFEQKKMNFPKYKPIYIDAQTRQQYTWAETRSAALYFGEGLLDLWDWKKGDVLGIFSPNCIDTPAIMFGTIWAGGIVSPLNPSCTVAELAFQLKDSGAKALVTQVTLLDVAIKAARLAGISKNRVTLIGDCTNLSGNINHFSSLRGNSKHYQYQRPVIDPRKDLALLVYSSGTTGHPKGVMLSHENVIMNLLQIQATDENNLTPIGGVDGLGDKIMSVLPYYHVYGIAFLVNLPLYMGLTTIVMSKFSLKDFLQAIQTFQPVYANLVPPIILHLAKSPLVDEYDISSLKMVMCGAAPLTQELTEELYQRHGIPVRQVYGLSETSPVALVQTWNQCRESIGSVGGLVPNMAAKFCDESGGEISLGHTGELYLKGPNIFQGYLNNPSGTLDCLDKDGWFRTGDVGHVDAKGSFYITDRVKELIKYKGFQVPPAELEGLLLNHPQVMDAAVIGVMSERDATELPRAYVVLAPAVGKTRLSEAALIEWLSERVAPHKRLRGGVEFICEIPKSPSGKILRRLLRDRANQTQRRTNKGFRERL